MYGYRHSEAFKTQSEITSIGCRMVKDKMYKTLSYTLLGNGKNICNFYFVVCIVMYKNIVQIKKINVHMHHV